MEESKQVTIDDIISSIKKYQPIPITENSPIIKAYNLAESAHKGQLRASGEAYIIHPLNVAAILAKLKIDSTTITAALLHDVVEDTIYTIEEMQKEFGSEVAMLIDGVTKLSRIECRSKEELQLENYRKMFLAMAKDIRVIMIKLADRLHNMRTLKYMPPEKQQRIAKETIEVYAPLANRLGISSIKWELEDLCLRYLEPKIYYELVASVKEKRKERQAFIDEAIESIKNKLIPLDIDADISGRPKHFYSIYKKMIRDHKDISEIYDLSAIRIIVPTKQDCYGALGAIHDMWKPIPGRFKDYIAVPKTNGYQSLHTTVMANGSPLEIQIRTLSMHKVSEFGIAAHWKYKEKGKNSNASSDMDQKMSWLRQMVSLQQELSDSREYFEALKVDVFSDEVFVFTKDSDVVNLPKGSTPIDFAYRIHTEVGHHCTGAKVNEKMVPLEYKLKNGDIVTIITNESNNGPSRDWLNIVASSDTRSKIRAWFKKEKREENIERGREMLVQEAKHLGYNPKEVIRDDRLKMVAEKLNILTAEDLLASIGYGGIQMQGVLKKLVDMHKDTLREYTPESVTEMIEKLKNPAEGASTHRGHGILVEGEAGVLVRLARCCNPIPGDNITGYITRGRGVSVHRSDCPNVLMDKEFTRMIEVSWDVETEKTYTVEIKILCSDSNGVLAQLIAVPSDMRYNIHSVNASPNKGNKTSTVILGLDVRNSAEVESIMGRLRQLKDVYTVSRVMSSQI